MFRIAMGFATWYNEHSDRNPIVFMYLNTINEYRHIFRDLISRPPLIHMNAS